MNVQPSMDPGNMEVTGMTVGLLDTRCYIAADASGEAVVIDPGADAPEIFKILKSRAWKTRYILLTHGHYDHIGGAADLRQACGAPLCIHEKDAVMLEDGTQNLSSLLGIPYSPVNPDRLLRDGDELAFGGSRIRVFHTPGHTPGSCAFLILDRLFAGDTLFRESVGRTDFPGSSYPALRKSIGMLLSKLTDEIRVMPGHGPETTIGHERRHNPFLDGIKTWI
ncbi:MBL fold metallo-hydrolase [bacterium]|nr:MBL fold metallo-hydrolase [bacterium]